MPIVPPIRPGRQVRVVFSATPLLSYVSVWRAAALAVAELGAAVFFIPGVVQIAAGDLAPWLILAACAFSVLVRAVDLESWALFIPGGSIGRIEQALGSRAARAAAAARFTERLLLAALACVVAGHYGSGVAVTVISRSRLTGFVTPEDVASLLAIGALGLLWIRARSNLALSADTIAKGVWIGIAVLLTTALWGAITWMRRPIGLAPLSSLVPAPVTFASLFALFITCLRGFAMALPVVGSGDALARAAHELPPPRVVAVRRTARLVLLFTLFGTTLLSFLFLALVRLDFPRPWTDVPLAAIAQHLAGPGWLRDLLSLLIVGAALALLIPAARAALIDGEQTVRKLAGDGVLPARLASLHPRFGTPAHAIDVTAAAVVAVMLASSGRVQWLTQAYALAIACTTTFKIAALVRLREKRPGPRPYRAPFNVRLGRREVPVGLLATGVVFIVAAASLVLAGDVPAVATGGLILALATVFNAPSRRAEARGEAEDLDPFELLPSSDLSLGHVQARPGGLLVPVRNPYSLSHVAAAFQAAGDRDVVVMTARLVGVDTDELVSGETEPTPSERYLLSKVIALAERFGRLARLIIVPSHNVFDAVVATALKLKSSEVYVGESTSLSAEEQARSLGEAWERAEKPDTQSDIRLVIHHPSGRADAYHLGAHPPSLTPGDLDLIHRVWLDAAKAIGSHVHHHDVVRAALTQMEQQLKGPQREEALAAIRQVARPADELAAAVRARDFPRLRDMTRNRHASDLALLLTDLGIEDQVVVFRLLPRKDASSVFEYLDHEAQDALLKAMAQEDVAALLNNMAPDDRTMFLEELPATATRQLLALLTPAERAVALTLLGYPEDSIGRLMTPHYVAVREQWTVREVLDYVRTHGQDSETLNVIYVIDEQGGLIDDIRIREFLLTSLDQHVADLMDRRFVALKATDDQQTAVAAFRQYDRSALPVTDSAGMLIGIVTIDDVLDVAEAAATKEIQRIGGSEALDEPYIEIAFWRMIQKRAGWLTALFLGEMLTATAMGAFEAEISRAVVLALFVPLIISSGGNSGSQASTLVIRALALGEVTLRDWWLVMRRELMAGLALGTILGSIGFLRITLWSAFSTIYGPHWLLVALTVGLALVGIVLWGTLIGSLLPFLLRRFGFDPATSSAPFVATLVDVTGLVIYFSVALIVLRGTLL